MKKSNVFIAISVVFLSFMIIFYGSRLVYFYTVEHKEQVFGETALIMVLKDKSYDQGVKHENEDFYYVGDVLNNYVYYSNRYYRVLSYNDEELILVEDTASTILPYDDIESWLNTTYYNSLNEPNKYVNSITILSPEQYNKAGDNGNFLNGNYTWLKNGQYATDKGKIAEADGLYGVKAVLLVKKDTAYYGGTGTYFDPYFITLEDAQSFNEIEPANIGIGSYIKYSDRVWRVIDTSAGYRLALTETLDERRFSKTTNVYSLKDAKGAAYYLNNTFLDELDTDLMIKSEFNVGAYDKSYTDARNATMKAYVGMIGMGDMFMSDLDDYYTLTNTGIKNTVYKVTKGILYADSYTSKNLLRPVITISKDIKITAGYGTIGNPYEVVKK